MRASLLHTAPLRRPAPVPTTEFVVRAALAALAVIVCYQFGWDFLRFIVSELNLRLDALAGVNMQRVSPDTVLWQGQLYRYVIACSFADVWCGAVPLLWDLRRNLISNIAKLLLFGIVLVLFDVFRLSVSDVLFAHGAAWDWAHGIVGGLAYLAVWIWIWEHKPFRAFRESAGSYQQSAVNS